MSVSAYASLLEQLRQHGSETYTALFYVDIRHLRSINRIANAAEGDAVIERVEVLLKDWVGRMGFAGRLWSNEFLAAKAIDHTQVALDEASDLRDRLAALQYKAPVGDTALSASIGVKIARSGCDWGRAIGEAGEACETAKRRGLNQIYCHSPGDVSHNELLVNARYITEFRRLLAAGALALHPQPIMDIAHGEPKLRKAEFLLRMEKDGVHMPVPAGTIDTLEHFGLISELDRFSSAFILDWMSENLPALERLHSVSINLSGCSMVDGAFMGSLLRDVRAAHLPAGKLCFEITETAAIEHIELAAEIIEDFRGAGCSFSLDDFGSGLCSFGYLHSLPVDEVKIDGRFVRDVVKRGVSQEIVRAIHQVAHATGKRTVAEFVDDPRKLEVLRDIGVNYAQGWLFYPTVAPEKLLELLGA